MTPQAYHARETLKSPIRRRTQAAERGLWTKDRTSALTRQDKRGAYFVPARSAPQSKNGRRESRSLTLANLPSYQRLRRFDFLCFLQFLCHRCSSLEAIPLLLLQGHRLFEFLGLLQALRHGCSPLRGSRSTPCAASASRVYVQMAGQCRGKGRRNASAAESCR